MKDELDQNKKTILVVDDEQPIIDVLVCNLQREGYNTLEATDGEMGFDIAQEKRPDLILLDVMLPKMDGLTVCKKIKQVYNVPVLMVSARSEEIDKIVGLELGADDYISKPFSVREVMARVKANLRKSEDEKTGKEKEDDKKSNNGGTRHLAQYDCFKYTLSDFMEKARVLKEGSFLVEILPAENENNFDYLYEIKKMAEQAGFKYYAKVAWKKGTFVSNTGRKAKNTEDIMIFSKGKPRALRPDKQRGVINGVPTRFMSGANGMLPTEFNVQAIPNKLKNVQTEKPVALFEQLLEYFTLPGELVLDQFAGSGVTGEACLNKKRKCILIEKWTVFIEFSLSSYNFFSSISLM